MTEEPKSTNQRPAWYEIVMFLVGYFLCFFGLKLIHPGLGMLFLGAYMMFTAFKSK